MSLLTPNFKPFGLSPRIEIYDYSGVLQKTYESANVKSIFPIAAIDFEQHVNDIVGDNNGTINDPNLKLRMKFNGDILDESGLDNNGTIVAGTTKYVPRKDGLAFDFDGSTYMDLDNETNFDRERTDPFSFSVWINDDAATNGYIFDKRASSIGFGLLKDSTGRLEFFLQSTPQLQDIRTPTGSITIGQWQH